MIQRFAISPLQWMRSPYGVLDGALAKGCMTFTTRLPVMGSCLVTGDPKLIGEIARNPVLIGGRGTEALRPVVGEHSLIALEGERHRIHRGVLLPHFFSGNAATIDRVTRKWADALNALQLPGVRFVPTTFTPTERQYAKEKCNGVFVQLTDRETIVGVDLGLAMAATLRKLYPNEWKPEKLDVICVNRKLVEAVTSGRSFAQLKSIAHASDASYAERRAKALIYPD